VALLELSKGRAVALPEGIGYRRQLCDSHSLLLSVVDAVAIGGHSRIELTDKLLIRVVALAILRHAAEHPDGDRKRES
jgi:hypothetical protein